MKKWYHILWGSKEEDEHVTRIQEVEEKLHGMGDITDEPSYRYSPDPDEVSIENAYATRWIWYHTILAGLMFLVEITLLGIFILLAIKL